jgi:hypothetical protein
MMNPFLKASIRGINKHGIAASYIEVAQGVFDPETLGVVNTETTRAVTVFQSSIKVNQYNYPNLVGKEVCMFYLANNSLVFNPKVRDKITYSGSTYTIENLERHTANGEVVLFTFVASKN